MGTRPEIIKMAPVYLALKQSVHEPMVLHTGQHDAMSRPLYKFFGIDPAYLVDLPRERDSLGHLCASMIDSIDDVLNFALPDVVLVHGDTLSALAAAMTAFYHRIPVGHVEAGLRSHIDDDPFPEEMTRELIARLVRWHFAPTAQAVDNLTAEGIAQTRIHLVGNTIVDAVHWGISHLGDYFTDASEIDHLPRERVQQALDHHRLVLVTAHRRENWGNKIINIARGVRKAAQECRDLMILWPVHPNPIVSAAVHETMDGLDEETRSRIILTPPLNYPELLWALQHAWLVLTDSGGIQEEAVAASVPVLVLRDTTERPELITVGGGALIGTTSESIQNWVLDLTNDATKYKSMRNTKNPFGDGKSGEYIVKILSDDLSLGTGDNSHNKNENKYGLQ